MKWLRELWCWMRFGHFYRDGFGRVSATCTICGKKKTR